MRIKEIIDRAGVPLPTGHAVAIIREALDEIGHMVKDRVAETDVSIVQDKRYYDFPSGLLKLRDLRVLNHDNDEDKYRSIPRLMFEPREEDADGV